MSNTIKLCEECHEVSHPHTEYGFSCYPRAQIYQWILSKIYETDKDISSNEIADVLQKDHREVMLAMLELHKANPSCFIIKYAIERELFQLSEKGKQFLARPLIQMAENGLSYDAFLKFYPKNLTGLAFSNGWVKIDDSSDNKPYLYVVTGAQKRQCEELYEMLANACEGRLLPAQSKSKLFHLGFAQLGGNIVAYKMKKNLNFPTNRNEMVLICARTVHQCLSSMNRTTAS